jgi:membrane protease YdiL (CAAX protease family)
MTKNYALAGVFSLAALALSITAMLAGGGVAALFGMALPETVALGLGVAGPALAALVFAIAAGRENLAALGRRLASLPRLPALALIPLAYGLVAIAAAHLSGGRVVLLDPSAFVAAAAVQFAVVALLEEIGWRGWLTPTLLGRMTPLAASILVALGWFMWHAPKFAIGPAFTGLLFVGCFAHSIVMTAMIADRRAGLWACVILHGSVNLSQVVLDPKLSSMSAQYAAFGAAVGLSCVFAVAVFRAKAAWFLNSGSGEPGVQRPS